MGIKEFLSLPFAKFIVRKNNKWKNNALKAQSDLMISLVEKAKNTTFGKDHNFSTITTYSDFKKQVPIRNYEDITDYIEQIIEGRENVF
jgi:hypothetical protein